MRHGLAGYIAGALSVSRCRGIARREARGIAEQRTDAIERLRDRADALTTRAEALRRLADAEKPLYQSLDEAQKRRFDMAVRFAARQHMAARNRRGRPKPPRPRFARAGWGSSKRHLHHS